MDIIESFAFSKTEIFTHNEFNLKSIDEHLIVENNVFIFLIGNNSITFIVTNIAGDIVKDITEIISKNDEEMWKILLNICSVCIRNKCVIVTYEDNIESRLKYLDLWNNNTQNILSNIFYILKKLNHKLNITSYNKPTLIECYKELCDENVNVKKTVNKKDQCIFLKDLFIRGRILGWWQH